MTNWKEATIAPTPKPRPVQPQLIDTAPMQPRPRPTTTLDNAEQLQQQLIDDLNHGDGGMVQQMSMSSGAIQDNQQEPTSNAILNPVTLQDTSTTTTTITTTTTGSTTTTSTTTTPPEEPKGINVVIAALADATISESSPYTTYGKHPQLLVDGGDGVGVNGSGRDSRFDTLLKFDVSFLDTGLGLPVDHVTLRLYVKDGASHGGTFRTIRNTWWDESSINWENAPETNSDNGIVIGEAHNVVKDTWFELDVTRALQWVRHESGLTDPNATKMLSVRVSTPVKGVRAIYSSLDGDALLAPHLLVALKEGFVDDNVINTSSSTVAADTTTTTEMPVTVNEDGSGDLIVSDDSSPKSPSDGTQSTELPTPTTKDNVPSASLGYRQPGEALLLFATDDATIVKESPKTNLGQESNLLVSTRSAASGTALTHDILLQFDIEEFRRTVPQSVVLSMYVDSTCASAGLFTSTPGIKEWAEDEVTWETAPSLHDGSGGVVVGTFGEVQGGKWIGFDVVAAFSWVMVTSSTSVTFRITSEDGGSCEYGSIQGGKAPKMIIQF